MRLDWLSPLSQASGPFTSVCLDASRTTPGAAHEVELRWAAHRSHLEVLGAPQLSLSAIQDTVLAPTRHAGPFGRLLIASGEDVVVDLVLPDPPVRGECLFAPVPHLMPAVRGLAASVPYLLVRADRSGADIEAVALLGEHTLHEQVQGDHDVLHKVPGGGWSHRRYQQRVEDSWERNADEVAEAVDSAFRQHAADLVFVAGDSQAVSALLGSLGKPALERVVRLDSGGRAAGGSEEALDEEVRAGLDQYRARLRAELVESFSGAEARQQEAVQGVAAVVDVLRRAQVDELLLQDDPSSTLHLWVGAGPLELAQSAAELADLGVESPTEVRADAALLWALLGSGGAVTLVEPDEVTLTEGIGALLRWSDASTPHDQARSMPGHGEPRG